MAPYTMIHPRASQAWAGKGFCFRRFFFLFLFSGSWIGILGAERLALRARQQRGPRRADMPWSCQICSFFNETGSQCAVCDSRAPADPFVGSDDAKMRLAIAESQPALPEESQRVDDRIQQAMVESLCLDRHFLDSKQVAKGSFEKKRKKAGSILTTSRAEKKARDPSKNSTVRSGTVNQPKGSSASSNKGLMSMALQDTARHR